MRILLCIIIFTCIPFCLNAQFPKTKKKFDFEQYPTIEYKEYSKWKRHIKELKDGNQREYHSLVLKGFYSDGDSLKILLSCIRTSEKTNPLPSITIFKNNKQMQVFYEDTWFFGPYLEPLVVADFNGDGLLDIKMRVCYCGSGLGWRSRVIYLFQQQNQRFKKTVFTDEQFPNRPERDFNGDGNFEIITMELVWHDHHNYWTFNLYNYVDGKMKNVSDIADYPIMIQYTNLYNRSITKRLTRKQMKQYSRKVPKDYSSK